MKSTTILLATFASLAFNAMPSSGQVTKVKPKTTKVKPKTTKVKPKTTKVKLQTTKVKLQTSMGDIVLELNAKKAPKSVANFLGYVKSGHFNGTVFHRVISNFMIQGGGLDAKMNKRPTKTTIQNEADNGLKNVVGSVAMARTGDPHSASAQFFINVNNNSFLNHKSKDTTGWGYAVFGKVVKGMEVVNKIKLVKTTKADVPVTPITIKKATIL